MTPSRGTATPLDLAKMRLAIREADLVADDMNTASFNNLLAFAEAAADEIERLRSSAVRERRKGERRAPEHVGRRDLLAFKDRGLTERRNLTRLGRRSGKDRRSASGELLPCPFCGGEPNEVVDAALIACRCGTDLSADSPEKARAAWNRRSAVQPPAAVEAPGFVSGTCAGVTCHMCGKAPAVVKVGEEIAYDDPNPHRHNATAYLCAGCEEIVLHGAWLRAALSATGGEAREPEERTHDSSGFAISPNRGIRAPIRQTGEAREEQLREAGD